ncbi:DUF397 domain-containing protein [Streptomyces hypolithicus]
MTDASAWQKSSYCAQGEACVSVTAASGRTVKLSESADPAGVILTTNPTAFAALLRTVKES